MTEYRVTKHREWDRFRVEARFNPEGDWQSVSGSITDRANAFAMLRSLQEMDRNERWEPVAEPEVAHG